MYSTWGWALNVLQSVSNKYHSCATKGLVTSPYLSAGQVRVDRRHLTGWATSCRRATSARHHRVGL